jgi:hypothetical protein
VTSVVPSRALAVICHRPGTAHSDRDTVRAVLEARVEAQGFTVIDVFEAHDGGRLDHASVELLVDLVHRRNTQALLIFGDLDEQARSTIAARCRVRMLMVPALPTPGRLLPAPGAHVSTQENTLSADTSPTGVAIPDSESTTAVVEVPCPAWTGRLEFDLRNRRGRQVDTVEVVVRIDNVTLWSANRTLAVMDREVFGWWLIHPERVLTIDDVAWSVQDVHVCITLDNCSSYVVPEATIAQLMAVI